MRNNDPLSSLNMAPTAAQLEYRESAPDRVKNFISSVSPIISNAAKGVGSSFKDSFVGDTYRDGSGADSDSGSGMDSGADSDSGSGLIGSLLNGLQPNVQPTYSGSGKVQAKPITYSDWSDTAKYFGMDQATAYAEHMANTAHQREVADLRAAGLNPVLGLGSGASGVTGHSAASGGGSSSSAKKNDAGTLLDVIGATVGFLASIKFGSSAGSHASKAVSGLGKLFGNK